MYIFPEIGHNSVKKLLITLHYEVTIYEEHLLTRCCYFVSGEAIKGTHE